MDIDEMDDATKDFLGVMQCPACGHIAPNEDFMPPEEMTFVSSICPSCGDPEF